MSTWVVGDIHSSYDEFMKLLNKINFSDADDLYLLGDYFDRGGQPAEMARWLIENGNKPNIHLLLGNHDDMLLKEYDFSEGRHRDLFSGNWFYNGGVYTDIAFEDIPIEELQKMRDVLQNAKYYYVVEVDGRTFVLTHGCFDTSKVKDTPFYGEDTTINALLDSMIENPYLRDDLLWGREFRNTFPVTWVFGHTPTKFIWTRLYAGHPAFKCGEMQYSKNTFEPIFFYTLDQLLGIALDTGCCYVGNLTALNLETLDYICVPTRKEQIEYICGEDFEELKAKADYEEHDEENFKVAQETMKFLKDHGYEV